MLQFNALLFDLDGTLFDTAPDFISAVNQQLAAHQRPPLAPDVIRSSVTDGSPGLVRKAFNIAPEESGFETLREELLAIYLQHLGDQTVLFPGLHKLVKSCVSRGLPWGIVTNKPWLYTEPTMLQLPLMETAACVICPDHVRQPKPDPEGLQLASHKIGIAPHACLYVGDHIRDIEAGRRAGMRTIAAGWGYIDDQENLANWRADWIVERSQDLYALLFED